MKTIFDQEIRLLLIHRIEQINDSHKAKWGKMNVFQMLMHNTYWNGWVLGTGDHSYKQAFLGKIFGKIALKKMIKDEKPFDKNIPTSDQFKPKALAGNLEAEKAKWIDLIKAYETYNNPKFIHDFFGKMTKEQIGILVYKHTDHHLRQFGL
ncbi:DUF1569 domain-containing protein [Cyclobacterium sp. 1_MG-2023]|uniref:DUF1569 domain-containing protein n=1 Tax=Cyclobacterium sp. 1_MG-2023 TaxID=3062681 RepID=UPI0026E2D4D2|nr:DUF1569 domain-containing protein [Cyclobacterium sp. 1_MG-2023]MDO6437339.1 DUF1569 domain-containing protein [Cyclobacterium sp. 1_MG-2023]